MVTGSVVTERRSDGAWNGERDDTVNPVHLHGGSARRGTLNGDLVAEFDPTGPDPRPMQGVSNWWTGNPGAAL